MSAYNKVFFSMHDVSHVKVEDKVLNRGAPYDLMFGATFAFRRISLFRADGTLLADIDIHAADGSALDLEIRANCAGQVAA